MRIYKIICSFCVVIYLLPASTQAQNYVFAQLSGVPVNTTGWNLTGAAYVGNVVNSGNREVILTTANNTLSGGIFFSSPVNLSQCIKWTAEFDFRMHDGTGADGLAFCFLDVPPAGFATGQGLGIPAGSNGLKVCFDDFPNCNLDFTTVPKIEIRWGTGYNECNNTMPTLANTGGNLDFIRSTGYNHAKIVYDDGNISVYVNNTLYLTGFQQFSFTGYFGFTAATGAFTDIHSIKNAIIYTNAPVFNASSAATICPGASAQIGATSDPTYTYSWSPSTGLSDNTISNPYVSLPNGATTAITQQYIVTTSLAASPGCSSKDTITVTVNPNPTVTVNSPTACSGYNANVVATPSPGGSYGYTWSVPSGAFTPGTNTTSFNTNVGGTYTVSIKNNSTSCISSAASGYVTILPQPTASISGGATICSGGSTNITFSGTPNAVVTYTINGGSNQTITLNGSGSASISTGPLNSNTSYALVNVSYSTSPSCSRTLSSSAYITLQTVTTPNASVTTQPTCATPTGIITVYSPTGSGYIYSIDGTTYQSSTTFSGVAPGTYNVTVKNSGGCISLPKNVTINTAPSPPSAPGATVTSQPTCSTSTGIIAISSPTGSGYSYSINGTTYQTSTTFNSVGAGTYNVTVKNSNGCVSSSTAVTVNAAPTVPATPTASATQQPTCASPTGTINVSSPTGAGLTYSIDGTTYQSSTTFTGLAPGIYKVTVTNGSGCVSSKTSVTINGAPTAPVAPTASVTVQPTCASPTGTIRVTAPTGAGYTYSINGSTYQSSTTFSGIAPGTYNVTVKNATGCPSAATSVTVNAVPLATTPAVSVSAQPTCTISTGTISISSPIGAGYTYSINGSTYQSSTTFSGIAPGTYNVTVRDAAGCISLDVAATVNTAPSPPSAPAATVVQQPTCTISTGTISISSPTGAGYTYSINGTTYQSSTTFNAAPGTYNVTVKDATGCLSSGTSVTVTAVPVPPSAPSASVSSQPTCTIPTGTIVITSPTGAGYTYSIDGNSYQSSTTFAGIAPGTYNVTVTDATGCLSSATSVTVTAVPVPPSAPGASVSSQPTCTTPTGTIIITSPTGAGLTYSIDGTTYQSSTTFTGIAPGTYNVLVKNTNGCISPSSSVTVNSLPSPPSAPAVSIVSQYTCSSSGTISISSPVGAGYVYSANGVVYQSSTTLSGLSAGIYNVTVKDGNGCVSSSTPVTIAAIPLPPAPGATVSSQPTCTNSTGTITIFSPTGSGYTYSINGSAYQSSTTFNSVSSGTYNVTVKDGYGCISPASSLTVDGVPPSVTPAVNITPSATSICSGSPVTFTATPSDGGASPIYQWQVNGVNVGTNSSSFTSSSLNNGDIVKVIMTSNAPCLTTPNATSNGITISISSVTPSVSITASSSSICSGNPITFTATPTNGGTSPSYQWQVNGVNVGTNSPGFTSSSLNNGDVVKVVLTSNASCITSPTATSNAITITISSVTPSVDITASSSSICIGNPVTFTPIPTNGGTSPIYQWQVNGINVGTNSSSFTSSSLNNGDVVKVIMTSNASCITIPNATSNGITILISSVTPSVSITASSSSICSGNPVTFTAIPTNGGTSPSYQWQVNGTDIPGATSSSFTSSSLVNGDVVKVVLTSNASCITSSTATSNAITITTSSVTPSISITVSSTSICSGSPVTFNATPINGGTSPTYQWQMNGVNVGTNSASFTSSSLNNGDVVKVVMTSNATCITTPNATSNAITITTSSVTPSVNITASSSSICSGNPVTFTATPTNGGASPVYQWQVNGVNVGGNSQSFTSSSLNNGDIIKVVMTSNASCVTTSNATSNAITISTSSVTPSVNIIASSSSICSGNPVTFTAASTNGGTSPGYQWQVNGLNVGTNSASFTSSSLNNGDVVKVVMTSNATCITTPNATSNAITITTSSVTPSVNITASSSSICSGNPVTFTATPTNCGTSPSYQWQVNGINVGTNSASFTSSSLNNGDVVKVIATSNASCITSPTATSNPITITTSSVTPSVSITASSSSICSGNPVTFTATPTNGGTSPSYQWLVNGANVGTNSATFTSNSLSSGDIVSVVMTSNASCITSPNATSNAITITISSVTPAVSITASSSSICSGNPVTFTATPTNGGTSPGYQWQVNGLNVGTNSASFTSSSLNNSDVVKVVLTSNASCITSPTAISNDITITTSSVTPSVNITASSSSICSGNPVTFTATPINGGTSPSYQWQVNGINVGTSSSSFTSGTLNSGDVVKVVLTSNASCITLPTAISNAITITTSSITPSVSITASSSSICSGNPITFTAIPTNGGTSPIYQWQVNGINVGTNSSSFTSSSLNNGDIVKVVLTSNASCITTPNATSNAITITTSSVTPSVSITASSSSLCSGNPVTFIANPTNGGASPSYQWQVNSVNVGTNSASFTSSSLNNGDVVKVVMTSNASCITTSNATSNAITISASSVIPSVSITASSSSICSGNPITFTATPTNGGTSPSYQWQVNGVNVGTNSPGFTSSSLNNGDVVKVVLTSNASCITSPTATSNAITITTSSVTPSVSITASSSSICSGNPVTFTATLINGGISPSYQWQVNGGNIGTNSASFTSNSLSSGDIVSVVMTSNASCVTTPNATSNSITITTSSVTPSVNITASSSSICSGNPVTFIATPANGGASPSYQWQVNGADVGTNAASFTSSTLNNGDVVKAILTSNASCITTPNATSNAITITTSSVTPSVSITASSTSFCSGSPVTFNATAVNGGTSPSYQWQVNGGNIGTNISDFTSNSLKNGDAVNVIMTSNASCVTIPITTSNTQLVNVFLNPSAFLPADTAICDYETIVLDQPSSYVKYLWNTNATTPSITVSLPGMYWLQVTDMHNCQGRDSIIVNPKNCIKGVYFPTGFTPNGDGKNDVFKPHLYGEVLQYQLIVYNRWGQIVFQSQDTKKGWDGTINGVNQKTDAYVWVCRYQLKNDEQKLAKGTIVLIR